MWAKVQRGFWVLGKTKPKTYGMSILPKARVVLIMDVSFVDDAMQVILTDGREIRVPLEWFPKLRDARPEARRNWRLIGKGIGIHWPDVDEDVSLEGMLS